MDYSIVMIAGDSGDGIQVSGHQLTYSHAHFGHVVQTATDFPAEIRAPAGTRHGVSGFQLCFSSRNVKSVGEKLNYLIAFNPAAYAVCRHKCTPDTLIIYDQDKWTDKDLAKAGYAKNPLEDQSIKQLALPLTSLTIEACSAVVQTLTQAKKNRNMTALGVILWLHHLELEPAESWIKNRFRKKPDAIEAAISSLRAGYYLGETLELARWQSFVPKAPMKSGRYAQITGNQAFALGCVKAAEKWLNPVYVIGYPITPASDILHYAHAWNDCHVHVVQAEDEIAAAGMALGASYAGSLAVTCTSGPGFDLKSEMIGLAVMAELPLVVIDVQRAGPSTGMPTKTEQGDLQAALYGRHGECPVPVLAPSDPSDCMDTLMTAFEWAMKAMTPVIILSDASLAQASCQFKIEYDSIKHEKLPHAVITEEGILPYQRNADGARPWIVPGTIGGAHRLGGLEKQHRTGDISYDGSNHELMIELRQKKIEKLAIHLDTSSYQLNKKFLFVTYGSPSGPLAELIHSQEWNDTEHLIIKTIYPLPVNFWEILSHYETVIIVELSSGQLARYLRSYAKHPKVVSYTQMTGLNLETQSLVAWMNDQRRF